MEDKNHNKNILIIMFSFIILLVFIVIVFTLNKKDNSIYVYFFSEGGSPVEKIKIKKGESITLPNTTRNGYQFLGWYRNDVKVSNNTKYNETTTLYAKWVEEGAKTFTIKFDSDGGTDVENLVVECNKALKLPLSPTKEGYVFVNWLDTSNNPILDESILSCEDITLKAEWKKIEDKKEEIKDIKYTCPNGYTLNGRKCSLEKNALERCPNGSVLEGDSCISQTDVNNGNIVCKTIDVETNEGVKNLQGEYFNGKCGYFVYDLNQEDCNYTWDNGKCYAKVVENGFDKVCNDGYILKDDYCKRVLSKEFYCENGYNLNNNKCIRTIDATIR